MKNYIACEYCPNCEQDTDQIIWDSQHERDGSNDAAKCLLCGLEYSGYLGKWHKPTPGFELPTELPIELKEPCHNWKRCKNAKYLEKVEDSERWECLVCKQRWTINYEDIS